MMLNLDRLFRGEAMDRPIKMTVEGHSLVIVAAKFAEAEDLETTGISQHGTVPGHEPVQAAHVVDKPVTGPHVEMVSVGEDERCTQFSEFAWLHRFDRRLSSNGREDWRL